MAHRAWCAPQWERVAQGKVNHAAQWQRMPAMPQRVTADGSRERVALDSAGAAGNDRGISDVAHSMESIEITAKRRRELDEKFSTTDRREHMAEIIRCGRIAAAQAALSDRTWEQNTTIMRFWFEFCEVHDPPIDPTKFGLVNGDHAPPPSQIAWCVALKG